jgi:glucose/arabinose dehydrogenase
VEYPRGSALKVAARGITAGAAIAFVTEEGDYKGALLVAESGRDVDVPRIYGWKADGTLFNIYPYNARFPSFGFLPRPFDIHGPIGGMAVTQGKIFVTHRDSRGRGVVSKFGFDGSCETVVGELPAQGDYGMTDIAVDPRTGRLYFGVGAATNSGVVGLDNWQVGWVKQDPEFSDRPYVNLKLQGFKFVTANPIAGLFGGADNVGTAPFQPFGRNNQLRISKSPLPTSAIYSISPAGGDLRIEAHGIRYPRGLAFYKEYAQLFATNDGMELRGSRPVKDDPDALLKVPLPGPTWFGWPDYSSHLQPIDDPKFTERSLIIKTGYPELTFLINHAASGLTTNPETYKDQLLVGIFPSLSGAAKFDFDARGNAFVALFGDRAPFATSGQPLVGPVGYKVVRVNYDNKRVEEYIHNTEYRPASMLGRNVEAIERPVDVKFGPDGRLYVLDYGRMEMRGGREKIMQRTGRIFVLEPTEPGAN